MTDGENEVNKIATELVISYAFPPDITTSGNVVAKRIISENKNVDVISATFSGNKGDFSLADFTNQFIHNIDRIEVNDVAFHSGGMKFLNEGLDLLNNRPTYEKVYSRVQFMPSHLLGLFYKASHDTYWVAEFSDPVIYSQDGYMSDPIGDIPLIKEINDLIHNEFNKVKDTDTVNEVIQYTTFIMADEIIFTNENQMKIMLKDFPEIEEMVLAKSKIVQHPILDESYYHISDSDYEVDDNYINFAYFGVLYGNRSFEDFIAGFTHLNDEFKDKFRLHIFTIHEDIFKQILPQELLEKTIINSSVDYLDFLNITTKMDVLLAEDAITDHIYDLNPYLPSKISDYLGSGADIWAVCENGSIMSKMDDIRYKSNINDLNSSIRILNQIMSDKIGCKVKTEILSQKDIISYYQKRHLQLLINTMNLSKKVECHELKESLQEYKDYLAYLKKFMRPHFIFRILKSLMNSFRKFKSFIVNKKEINN